MEAIRDYEHIKFALSFVEMEATEKEIRELAKEVKEEYPDMSMEDIENSIFTLKDYYNELWDLIEGDIGKHWVFDHIDFASILYNAIVGGDIRIYKTASGYVVVDYTRIG